MHSVQETEQSKWPPFIVHTLNKRQEFPGPMVPQILAQDRALLHQLKHKTLSGKTQIQDTVEKLGTGLD